MLNLLHVCFKTDLCVLCKMLSDTFQTTQNSADLLHFQNSAGFCQKVYELFFCSLSKAEHLSENWGFWLGLNLIWKLYLSSQTIGNSQSWNTKLMRLSQHKVLPHFWPFSYWARHSIYQAGLSSGQKQPPLALKQVAKSKFPVGRLLMTCIP